MTKWDLNSWPSVFFVKFNLKAKFYCNKSWLLPFGWWQYNETQNTMFFFALITCYSMTYANYYFVLIHESLMFMVKCRCICRMPCGSLTSLWHSCTHDPNITEPATYVLQEGLETAVDISIAFALLFIEIDWLGWQMIIFRGAEE
jgi:hypothetical protein